METKTGLKFLLVVYGNSKGGDNVFKEVLIDDDDKETLRSFIQLNFNNTENLKIEKDYFVIKGELFRYSFIPLIVIGERYFELKERKLEV